MPQYVIEFGGEQLRFIGAAIEASLAQPHNLAIDSTQDPMSYAATGRSLSEVLNDLETGTAASAIIRNGDSRIRYALISSPKLHATRSWWMGTIEIAVENWRFAWDLLLRQAGLTFVCVGAEEGVELGDEQVSLETFQWADFHLLVGAVRTDAQSDWVIRERVVD